VYVIGDTPADVRCGNEIGARVVAVASGSHSAHQLAAEQPFLVLEQIPPPDAFRSLLRLG
jgi:phosphoglycolate phosphatase